MREMLQKVPEGDWLCEECKFAEESENQKQGKLESGHRHCTCSLCELYSYHCEMEFEGSEVEEKKMDKLGSCTLVSGKRCAENIEVAPAKRQALETVTGSPKPSSPGRIVTGSPKPLSPSRIVSGSQKPLSPSKTVSLSRDSSFKSIDKGKVKSVHQTSFGNHSGTDIPETARFPATGPRLQKEKGKQIAYVILLFLWCFYFFNLSLSLLVCS